MPKLTCSKCGNDSFHITIREETPVIDNKVKIVTKMYINCSKCGAGAQTPLG